MGDREALKTFWEGYSGTPSIETMMLNKNAEEFDEHDRRDIWTSLPDLTGLRVVEIGSGVGRFTAALASIAEHVLATDFVRSFVEKNEEDNAHLGNVSFKCADAAHLDLEPENCDFVFTNWLLMYLTDVEAVHFLESVLRWLTPSGYLHFRESCSESSKRTPIKPDDATNPTHYRHICQYLSLLDRIRVHDERSGKLMRFEVLWAKSVETYVRVIPNWRQVHMLLRKVSDGQDGEDGSIDDYSLASALSELPVKGKEKFEREMAARFDLWGARSPLEPFVFKWLSEKMPLSSSDTVLTVFGSHAAAVSPFSIAETFGCSIYDLGTSLWTYDYNLAQANAKGDRRLRFQYLPGVARDIGVWRYVPERHFDVVVACLLGEAVGKLENVLLVLSKKVKLGGRIVLLERFGESGCTIMDSFTAQCNGRGALEMQEDVTSSVNSSLTAAVTQLERTPELLELQHEYQKWAKTGQETKWYVVSIAVK